MGVRDEPERVEVVAWTFTAATLLLNSQKDAIGHKGRGGELDGYAPPIHGMT